MKQTFLAALIGLTLVVSLLAIVMSLAALQKASGGRGPELTVTAAPTESTEEPSRGESAEQSGVMENFLDAKRDTAPELQATVRFPRSQVPATKEELESEATFVAEQLVDLLPDQALSLHVLAMLKAQLHQTAEAEELWERCIQLDETSEPYYVNLAAIQLDRGKSRQAVETLEAARREGLNSQGVSHHLGLALNSSGKPEQAMEVAQQALVSNPNSGGLWLILGQAQLQVGEVAKAETSLRNAIKLGINSKPAYFALFNACMRLGKREEAAEFREIYQSFQEQELSAEERYQVLSEAEARRICVSVLSESAAIYQAMPDLRTAEHLLLRVLALAPDNQAACQDLAKIYAEQGETANEIAARQRIIELDSLNLLNFLRLAKAYAEAGLPQSAEAQIKMAISFSPQTVTGYAAMTDFLMEQGQPEKAQWYVEQAIRLNPSAEGFELLAKTLSAQGKIQEAQTARAVSREFSKSAATKPVGDNSK